MKAHLLSCVLLFAAGIAQAQFTLAPRTTLDFATVEEAKAVLTTRDDYVQRLSPFDRAAKIQSAGEVSEADYLAAVAANVLPWAEPEKAKLAAAFDLLQAGLTALSLPLPPKILLIRTNGDDEGAAPYTRGNAIIFPDPKLQRPAAQIARTLCHELFHILSRTTPALREQLYRAIGFHKCGEVSLPPDVAPRKITNPDAPVVEHCVRVSLDGEDYWVAPVLYARTAKFEPGNGKTFFSYLQFRLLSITFDPSATPARNAVLPQDPKFMDPKDVQGFFEQIGQNTPYIIHPEEVLADNFVLLVQRKPDIPSPEIVEKLEQILEEHAKANLNRSPSTK